MFFYPLKQEPQRVFLGCITSAGQIQAALLMGIWGRPLARSWIYAVSLAPPNVQVVQSHHGLRARIVRCKPVI